MSRLSSFLILVCIGALLVETFAAPTDEPIIVRSKRQQCRCVKNPNGGLTCSCAKGPANGSSSSTSSVGTGVQYDVPQSADIANQLTAMSQQSTGMGGARCGCIQIVFQGAPQYNCQCGDQNGNPLPTTTTMAPTTTSTTTTTTTTTPAPTTTSTTTQAPVSYPQVPTQTQGNGACNCIMISITSPQTAQYQCQCAQPQQQPQYAETYDYTQVYTTQPPTTTTTSAPTTTTQAPTTQPPTTTSPVQYADTSATQYPLTTTCVMYVNVPTTACSCLPQYDQCAQNVCCLKAKYRSYKKAEETQPSTLDVLMNVLQTIKTKLE